MIRNIKLVVTNASGCSDSLTRAITIFPIPTAAFLSVPDSGCLPLTVTFTNQSTAGGTYAWNFGAGAAPATSAVFAPPPVVYSTPGPKIVSLIVVRNGCRDTITDTILVRPRPVVAFTASPTSGCTPLTVTFNNTTATVGGETWAWSFGDGGTSTLQNPPPYTYTNPGATNIVRPVKLVVTNGFGCSDSLTVNITVFPDVVAAFTQSVDSGCRPLTVAFTNQSTTGATYAWNFGIGAVPATSAAFTPPPVVYSTPGTQVVSLIVERNGCRDTITDTVVVRPRPVVTFTATPTSGCTPLTVAFNNTTTTVGGETWAWTFGDGATSTLQNPPPHVYTNPGAINLVRTVKLVVTNGFGCADSLTQTVTIFPAVTASFSNAAQGCVTFTQSFTNASTGANAYTWDFGDGSSSAATNPTHIYSSTGLFPVTLIAISGNGCRDTAFGNIQIDTIPDAQFIADTVCVGNATSFLDNSAGSPQTWAWTFGDGNTSNIQSPIHQYSLPGTYTVKLVVTNAFGCPDSITHSVLVNPIPTASFSATTECFGTNTSFSNTSTGGTTSWNWDFGDGNASNLQNPQHGYLAAGTYSVTLVVFSGVGCSDTVSQNVIVHPVPIPDFSADSVCFLLSTQFTDLSTGGPDTWAWDFGDGNTTTAIANPTHAYSSAGTYTVTMVSGYAATGCRDTMQQTVVVHPRPVAAFSTGTVCLNDTTHFSDLSTNSPNAWAWDFGDGNTSGIQNPTYVYALPGTYTVELWAQNQFGCADSTTLAVTVQPRPTAGFSADTVCQNLNTSYFDQSSNAVLWHWDFGDGDTSILSSPSHVYASSGSYAVTQIVWNIFGCTDTLQRTVQVDPLPVAGFAADTACFGYSTIFSDLSIANGSSLAWNWAYGDSLNGVSTVQNPSYVYADSGLFAVTLIVTNNFGCRDTLTQQVLVRPIPVAGFMNSVACAGNAVQFSDTSLNSPTLWSWNWDDGSALDNNQSPSHVYAVGGTYNVTFIAGNNAGCADTLVQAVVVNTVPVPAFVHDTVCAGNATHFSNLSTDPNPMYYLWEFGDGNSSPSVDPNYIYADSGNYLVQLTSYNNLGCFDSTFATIYVAPVPVPDFDGDTVCLGQSTIFQDASSAYTTTWAWDFGDGGTSNLGSPSHTFTLPGNQTVSLSISTAYGCAASITRNIFVEVAPVASFSMSNLACPGISIDFSNFTTGSTGSYFWDFGDGGQSTASNPSHSYASGGTYPIQLIASSSNGCADASQGQIVIHEVPVAEFSADTVCLGNPTSFSNISSGDSLLNWNWEFGSGGNSSSNPNPSYVYYPSAGTFNVSLTLENIWGCLDTVVHPILVVPQAEAGFSTVPGLPANIELYEGTISFNNTSLHADQYFWDFGDGNFSNETNPSHTYIAFGDFCIQLTATSIGGCSDTSSVCGLVILAGVPDIPNTFSPNDDGTNDVFEIRNIDAFPDNTLVIYNRWGNKVYEKLKYHNEWNGTNYRNNKLLPDGAYFYVFKPSPTEKEIVGDVVIFR